MKFRIVLKTKTKNQNDMIMKFNVAPSKHKGLINFLKMATDSNNPNSDVEFTVEKIGEDGKKVELSYTGNFKFLKREPEKK